MGNKLDYFALFLVSILLSLFIYSAVQYIKCKDSDFSKIQSCPQQRR